MNSYLQAGDNHNVGVEEIQKRVGIFKANLLTPEERGKPLVFWTLVVQPAECAHEPWDYTQPDVPIDMIFSASCMRDFSGVPWDAVVWGLH